MAEFDSIRSSTRSDSYVNIDSGLRAHMNKVYGLLAVAMIITGAVAWSIGTSPQLVSALFSNSIISLEINKLLKIFLEKSIEDQINGI